MERRARLANTRNQSQFVSGIGLPMQVVRKAAMFCLTSSVWFCQLATFQSPESQPLAKGAHLVEHLRSHTDRKAQWTHLDHSLILRLGPAPVFGALGVRSRRETPDPPVCPRILPSASYEGRETPEGPGERFERHSFEVIVGGCTGEVEEGATGRGVLLERVEDWGSAKD